jgi:uroporphyrinogen-III synthase
MTPLAGARVALLEARLASELAELVRREGGEPLCAPAVYEERLDVTTIVPALINNIRRDHIRYVVCLTGAGLASLFAQASELDLLANLVDALSGATIVCRGPKPAAVLRRHDIPVRIGVQAPHTTNELLAALATLPVEGKGALVLCDGGENSALIQALLGRGARVQMIRTYRWQLPRDLAPIEQLVHQLIDDRVDAVAFTTQVQVRHLFEIADRLHLREPLRHALAHQTIVGSIGPTCSAVLEEFGVVPHVVASPPRMRPLITAIGVHLAAREHTSGRTSAR